jgi:D-glycero-D-manno-heptose 1,7-bisphosphate phosphatase
MPAASIFLDRDGTIIEDAHYLSDPMDVKLLPLASEAIALLLAKGCLLFLFTNQSGVGRGYFGMDAVHQCNARMIELLGQPQTLFQEVCIAPERPDQQSPYRKPSPRFINECVARYGLDVSHCWMVGDKSSDIEAGANAGIRSALISSQALKGSCCPQYPSLWEFAQSMADSL